jgi:ABC-type transporter Mla MlaB component
MKTSKRKRATAEAAPPAAVAEPAPAPMAAPSSEPNPEPTLVLAANCTVKDAVALKASLCALAETSGTVTVDSQALERIDTATVQLLCAFVRDRASRNQRVTWVGESAALQEAARLLGVRKLLGLNDMPAGAAA